MKIGILGTGVVGNTIGSALIAKGHEVKIGSRTATNDKAAEWKVNPTVIFYLAVAPQLAPGIVQKLSDQKICTDPVHRRIVFEKPFGQNRRCQSAASSAPAN